MGVVPFQAKEAISSVADRRDVQASVAASSPWRTLDTQPSQLLALAFLFGAVPAVGARWGVLSAPNVPGLAIRRHLA